MRNRQCICVFGTGQSTVVLICCNAFIELLSYHPGSLTCLVLEKVSRCWCS